VGKAVSYNESRVRVALTARGQILYCPVLLLLCATWLVPLTSSLSPLLRASASQGPAAAADDATAAGTATATTDSGQPVTLTTLLRTGLGASADAISSVIAFQTVSCALALPSVAGEDGLGSDPADTPLPDPAAAAAALSGQTTAQKKPAAPSSSSSTAAGGSGSGEGINTELLPAVPPLEFDVVSRHPLPGFPRDPRLVVVSESGKVGVDTTPVHIAAAANSYGAINEKVICRSSSGGGGGSDRPSSSFYRSTDAASSEPLCVASATPLPARTGWVFWTVNVTSLPTQSSAYVGIASIPGTASTSAMSPSSDGCAWFRGDGCVVVRGNGEQRWPGLLWGLMFDGVMCHWSGDFACRSCAPWSMTRNRSPHLLCSCRVVLRQRCVWSGRHPPAWC
jgi:hypothetical protein